MMNIKDGILSGDICIIQNAFVPDFSEAMYRDLDRTNGWTMNKLYFDDDHGFCHNNVYSSGDFSPLFKAANNMFG